MLVSSVSLKIIILQPNLVYADEIGIYCFLSISCMNRKQQRQKKLHFYKNPLYIKSNLKLTILTFHKHLQSKTIYLILLSPLKK